MPESTVLVPNGDRVAAEILEDDAVIIHVLTGTYYSTQGIGGWVWARCAEGRSLAEIVALGTRLFEVSPEQFNADLESFAAALKEEDLVTERPATDAASPIPENGQVKRLEYKAPTLTIYRDLKDLLALDPPMPRLDLEAPATARRR